MMKASLIVIFLVIFSTVNSEQQDPHSDHRNHKKEHLGFFGSRGRRSIAGNDVDPTMITTTTEIDDLDPQNENVKQLSSLRDAFMNLQRSIRAPKGFFGMRGKKDYDLAMEKRALIQQNLNGLRERTRFIEPKIEELSDAGYPSYLSIKRAPGQAFFGVRGKKFGDYDMGVADMMSEKRAPSGFVGMRGKKNSLDLFDDTEIDDPQVFDYNYHEKRAPSGFVGMRGKKLYENSQPLNNFMYR